MKKKKSVKKAAKKASKKKAAKKAAPATKLYKAICNDEGLNLSVWTSRTAAYAARDAHNTTYPNHSCDVLIK